MGVVLGSLLLAWLHQLHLQNGGESLSFLILGSTGGQNKDVIWKAEFLHTRGVF